MMIWTLVGITFFLFCILIAFRIVITKQKHEEEEMQPMIHASGIYSIVRKSPRETIDRYKPDREKLRQYLADKTVDSRGKPLSEQDKHRLIEKWSSLLEDNIREIESGDKEGVEFYYYDIQKSDAITGGFVKNGHYVTREELHDFPQLIPPFHLGCTGRLCAHHGVENLRDTTELGIRPFFKSADLPPLPSWQDILLTP